MSMKKGNCKLHRMGEPHGPKVLLIHGAGFYWQTCFARIIRGLKDRYCLLIPVLEGHTAHPREYMVSVEETAGKLGEALEELRVDKVQAIYGVSLGASVAVEMAIRDKIKVMNLLLDGGQYEAMGEMTEQYANIMADAFLKLLAGEHLPSPVKENMGFAANNDVEVLQPLIYEQITREALLHAFLAAYRYDLKGKNARVEARISVMIGGNEIYGAQFTPLLEEISKQPLDIYEFPNRGHAEVLSKEPEKISRLLREILNYC